jgi:hypothetical protein
MVRTIVNHTTQDTINAIYAQAKDSIGFAKKLPHGNDPYSIYYYLKSVTTFKDDAKDIEQVQSLQTLLGPNNIHGYPGAGDCDCFTVAVLACLVNAGFDQLYIVLVGNNVKNPTHVYPALMQNGRLFAMDLTAPGPGIERTQNSKGPYRARQEILVKNL